MRETLLDELRDSVGDQKVENADVDVDRAVRASGHGTTPEGSRSRLMLVIFAALGVMVAAIVALALQSWVVLVALLALHAVVTTIVVGTALRRMTDTDKPAPTTVAQLEDEGVDDPEGALQELVDQVEGRDQRPRAQPDDAGQATETGPSGGDVAPPPRRHSGRKILALVAEPVSGEALKLAVDERADDAEILVVAPALISRTRHLLADPDPAIERAERTQQETVERMTEDGLDAAGDTGESDPVLAVTDALATFHADEIVLCTHAGGERNWQEEGVVDEVRKRFDGPVEHLVIERA